MKKSIIISAFPCCGKSYTFEHNAELSISDSDSSLFSWIYDENGNKTDKRNPDFPQNYIEHIKSLINIMDVIFVSSHLEVRKALKENNIKFYTVYPKQSMLNEWVGRMYIRGNDDKFIKFIINNWDKLVTEIVYEPYGVMLTRLGVNEYIDNVLNYIMTIN